MEIENRDIIELIYLAEGEKLDKKIQKINKQIKDEIKNIEIEKNLKNPSNINELKKVLETIEENYSIKIAYYNKEFYKQGFSDGVNLIINCLKNNDFDIVSK